jgi:hypothetical protein
MPAKLFRYVEGTPFVIALVITAGIAMITSLPAAAEFTLNEREAARNQPLMAPLPPLPVMFKAFVTAVFVSTVVYKGCAVLTYVSIAVSYTRLAPHASIVMLELPVCAHICTEITSPATAT